MDFSSTHWDLIRAGAYEDNEEPATDIISPNLEETCKMIDSVVEDLKRRLSEHRLDEQLLIFQVQTNSSIYTTATHPASQMQC